LTYYRNIILQRINSVVVLCTRIVLFLESLLFWWAKLRTMLQYDLSINIFIMLSVNFFCNISSYDILAYLTKNYIALIYYAKIVHLLCQFHAGKVGVIRSRKSKEIIQWRKEKGQKNINWFTKHYQGNKRLNNATLTKNRKGCGVSGRTSYGFWLHLWYLQPFLIIVIFDVWEKTL
jgi:hypothetical protein